MEKADYKLVPRAVYGIIGGVEKHYIRPTIKKNLAKVAFKRIKKAL